MSFDERHRAALEASIADARAHGNTAYASELAAELAEGRIPSEDDLVENWAYSEQGLDFESEANLRREDAREGIRRIKSAAVREYLAELGIDDRKPALVMSEAEIRDIAGGYGWVCTDTYGPVRNHHVSFEGRALCGERFRAVADRNSMGEYRLGDQDGDCPRCARCLAFDLTEARMASGE